MKKLLPIILLLTGCATLTEPSLMERNEKFALESALERAPLVEGQHPITAVLTCSDSRVAPEILFKARLGELFVVRVAGNVVTKSEIGSLEYAVEHLGVKNIMIIGHDSCGAVKAAVDSKEPVKPTKPAKQVTKTEDQQALEAILSEIRPAVKSAKETCKDDIYSCSVDSNIELVASNLMARSLIIKHAVEAGEVTLEKKRYSLKSGLVSDIQENK